MRRCITLIPWKLMEESVSATEIRPKMMIEAFREIGYEPFVITGDSRARSRLVSQLKQRMLMGEVFDFLYAESHTLPMMLTDRHHLPLRPFTDIALFALCKKHQIPIGLFYRDVYWAYPELKRFSTVKTYYTKLFHQIEILVLNKYLQVLFFPSDSRDELAKRIPLLRADLPFHVLMPGAPLPELPSQREDYFVFVGSVDHIRANISTMLQAFAQFPEHTLYLCTPKTTWESNKAHYSTLLAPNIRVVHYVNSGVHELLAKARYALNYFPLSDYRRIAIPYKLFEYIGYELPIICNRDDAAGRYISKMGIGYPLEFSSDALSSFLSEIPSELEYRENVMRTALIKETASWKKRAEYVARLLSTRMDIDKPC